MSPYGGHEGKTSLVAQIFEQLGIGGRHRGYAIITKDDETRKLAAAYQARHAARQRVLPERDPARPRGPGNCGCAHPLCSYCYPHRADLEGQAADLEHARTCRCPDPSVFGHGCGR